MLCKGIDSMKLRDLILYRLNDSLSYLKSYHEIVKYEPRFYDENGVYQKDEWTSFFDVGKEYEGKVVTMEDYLDVENRFIGITRAVLEAAGCSFVTLGYVESGKRKGIKEGMRVRIQEVDPFLRLALRGKAFIVFINKRKGIQFDYNDEVLYMHLYCRIPKEELQAIVESRGLYLDPRGNRGKRFTRS